MANKLTDKQKMFCKEYIVDLNATQAAIRAGYSEKTAYSIGSENLYKPEIQEKIQELMSKRAEKVEITAEDILNDIKDTRNLAKEKGDFNNNLRANELLGKHLKLFTDKLEVQADVNTTSTLSDEQLDELIKKLNGNI